MFELLLITSKTKELNNVLNKMKCNRDMHNIYKLKQSSYLSCQSMLIVKVFIHAYAKSEN